jgi:tRNA modification GTPase
MISKSTIFAVSTGSGRAGIAVVRVSGAAVTDIFNTMCGDVPTARRAVLRKIRLRDDGLLLDYGMVLYFPGPHSVTGEDVGEFHVHGSPVLVERLLQELGTFENCRPAEPGEFTRRAYENERMDLVEVEGLADLLASESEAQRQLAMRQFSGEASSIYMSWHQELVGALAIIEASIDFADEDGVAEKAVAMVRPRLRDFVALLVEALQQSEKAALIRRGLRIVIAGAPNVGKSSLLNALTGRKAAIVSEIAGTTRDVVEAALVINGLPVSISDTAGLRSATDDLIEREGMLRSRSEIESADILLWVTVAGTDAEVGPGRLPDLIVYNKSDLVAAQSIQIRNELELHASAHTGFGLDDLKKRLGDLIAQRMSMGESAVMVRVRHQLAIKQSIRFLNDAQMKPNDALELMAEDVRKAASAMASITGRVDVEDFLGRIFQEFCIGK